LIKNIAQGSTGEVSDIQVGDIITSFDDTPVTPVTIGELKRALGSGQDTLRLCWLSGDQSQCEDLKLASRFSE
jgi:S1-C subfamily serine protease